MKQSRYTIALILLLASGTAVASGSEPPAQRGSPAARLSDRGSGSEYWDIKASFDSGHFVFARFIVTNEGPGEHTGVGMGYLVFPDGNVREFKYGKRRDDWSISDDRLRLKVASAVLDFHPPEYRFEMDSDKRGVKLHLRFSPTTMPAWSDASSADERWHDLVRPPTPAGGTLWVSGMAEQVTVSGTISITHTWMNQNEADLVQRQIEVSARADDVGVYLSDVVAPDGAHRRLLIISKGEKIAYQTSDFEMAIGTPTIVADDEGYPPPGPIAIHQPGLAVEITPQRELLRNNPMDIIPQPFRFLLSFKSKPRRIWAASTLTLNLDASPDREALRFDGTGVTSVTYLNPTRDKE